MINLLASLYPIGAILTTFILWGLGVPSVFLIFIYSLMGFLLWITYYIPLIVENSFYLFKRQRKLDGVFFLKFNGQIMLLDYVPAKITTSKSLSFYEIIYDPFSLAICNLIISAILRLYEINILGEHSAPINALAVKVILTYLLLPLLGSMLYFTISNHIFNILIVSKYTTGRFYSFVLFLFNKGFFNIYYNNTTLAIVNLISAISIVISGYSWWYGYSDIAFYSSLVCLVLFIASMAFSIIAGETYYILSSIFYYKRDITQAVYDKAIKTCQIWQGNKSTKTEIAYVFSMCLYAMLSVFIIDPYEIIFVFVGLNNFLVLIIATSIYVSNKERSILSESSN